MGYEILVPEKFRSRFHQARSRFIAAAAQSKASYRLLASSDSFHIVRRGETLGSIAAKHKVSLGHLKRINELRSDRVLLGANLRIKPGSYRSSKFVRYKVRRGDNLMTITKRFGIPLSELKASNKIGNRILVLQTLKITTNYQL